MDYIEIPKRQRTPYLNLLLLADEDPDKVAAYMNDGRYFVGMIDGQPVVSLLFTPVDEQTLELKNLAVIPDMRRKQIATKALRYFSQYFSRDYATLIVGTGDADVDNLQFYLRNGFRFDCIRPNFFMDYPEPIYVNEVRLQDMVVLKRPMLFPQDK